MQMLERVHENVHEQSSFVQSTELWTIAHDVGHLLVARGLQFRVWSGVQAAEIGGHRQSQDVDLWMTDTAIERVPSFLREATDHPIVVDELDDRFIIGVGANREVEIMARMDIHASDGGVYPLRMTPDVTSQSHPPMMLGNWRLPFAPPEDTILLKSILQRDQTVGKHDQEDVETMLNALPWVNEPYLANRIWRAGAEKRVVPFLRRCGLLLPFFR